MSSRLSDTSQVPSSAAACSGGAGRVEVRGAGSVVVSSTVDRSVMNGAVSSSMQASAEAARQPTDDDGGHVVRARRLGERRSGVLGLAGAAGHGQRQSQPYDDPAMAGHDASQS